MKNRHAVNRAVLEALECRRLMSALPIVTVANFQTSNLTKIDGALPKAASPLVSANLPAIKLALTQTPSPASSTAIACVEDANGNIVVTDNSAVTLTVVSTTLSTGVMANHTYTVPASNGVATFSNVFVVYGASYMLTATDGLLVGASSAFSVNATPAPTAPRGYAVAALNDLDATMPRPSGLVMDAAGNLYGTTFDGGANSLGSIFERAKSTGHFTTLVSFNGANGELPNTNLLIDSSGNLYGSSTATTGPISGGTIFELKHGGSVITTLAAFNIDGTYAGGQLTMDSSGNLYGITSFGGANNDGTVFELVKGSGVITTLASATAAQDDLINGLTIDSAGNLYGISSPREFTGGSIFELPVGATSLTTLATFDTNAAIGPGPMIIDSVGNLFGTTENGSDTGDGTVFKLVKGTSVIVTLGTFNDVNGEQPSSVLLMDSAGDLIGTTMYGGDATGTVTMPSPPSGIPGENPLGPTITSPAGDGTVFEIVAGGSGGITTVATFNKTNGSQPAGTLAMDSAGNLYGISPAGGANGNGTLFELSPSAQLAFTAAPSTGFTNFSLRPAVAVSVEDAKGNLVVSDNSSTVTLSFATGPDGAMLGGATSATVVDGVAIFGNLSFSQPGVYTLTAIDGTLSTGSGSITITAPPPAALGLLTGYDITTLASLNGIVANPSGVMMDSAGNLYGTTQNGGANNVGSIFEWSRSTGLVTTIASFNGADGTFPTSGLLIDSAGNLFGTTSQPIQVTAATGDGTVFELQKGASAITTLATFNGTNGINPQGNLAIDSAGNLYGAAESGGDNNDGTIFEVAQGSGAITVLASGGAPLVTTGVVVDSAGNLYGAAPGGINGLYGTPFPAIFEVVKGSGTMKSLGDFPSGYPVALGALTIDAAGNLYGFYNYSGSAYDHGQAFEVAHGSNAITDLPSPDGPIGSPLLLDSAGDLFGAAYPGIVFEIVAGGNSAAITLATFSNGSPIGPLSMDAAGNFHGLEQDNDNRQSLFELSPPSKLAFTAEPPTAVVGPTDAPSVAVSVEYPNGDIVTTDNVSTVTLTMASGPPGAMLGGTVTEPVVNGVATFNNLSFSTLGAYTLTATSESLAAAVSPTINVTPAPVTGATLGKVSLPSEIVSGAKFKARLPVTIASVGGAFKGDVVVNLYADATTSLDGNQVLVATLPKNVSLKPGKHKVVSFDIKSLPATLAYGTYHLLAEVVDPSGAAAVTATSQTLNFTAPVIQPTVTVTAPAPRAPNPYKIENGRSGTVIVTVTNNGNIAASGVAITLSPSTDGIAPIAGVVLADVKHDVKIQPGRHKNFTLHFTAPRTLAAGQYFPYIAVVLGDTSTTGVGQQLLTIK